MKKICLIIYLMANAFLFNSCAGKLDKQNAQAIINKLYTANNHPDDAGGSQTFIDYVTIDSIRQNGNTADVFYQVSGEIENGSKYPQEFHHTNQKLTFKKGFFSWKAK